MRVSTTDFIKQFGELSDKTLTEPVTITKNGRDCMVVISADEYSRLKRRDRQVYRTGEMPQDLIDAIAAAEPPAVAYAFDHEYPPKGA